MSPWSESASFRSSFVFAKEAFKPSLNHGLSCVQVGSHGETVEIRTDDGTFLVHERAGNVVLDAFRPTLGAELMLVLQRGLEDFILPVGADTEALGEE